MAMKDRPDEFYRLVRMTLTEFLVIYYELEQSIRAPRNTLAFGNSVDDLHINHMSHRTLHFADELLLFLLASDGAYPPVLARMFEVDRIFIVPLLTILLIISQLQSIQHYCRTLQSSCQTQSQSITTQVR